MGATACFCIGGCRRDAIARLPKGACGVCWCRCNPALRVIHMPGFSASCMTRKLSVASPRAKLWGLCNDNRQSADGHLRAVMERTMVIRHGEMPMHTGAWLCCVAAAPVLQNKTERVEQ